MDKELNDYLRLTFVQTLMDEWKDLCPRLNSAKSMEEAYEIYEDYELRVHNLTRYFYLRIKHDKEREDAKI
jgi:hypothetical protein